MQYREAGNTPATLVRLLAAGPIICEFPPPNTTTHAHYFSERLYSAQKSPIRGERSSTVPATFARNMGAGGGLSPPSKKALPVLPSPLLLPSGFELPGVAVNAVGYAFG